MWGRNTIRVRVTRADIDHSQRGCGNCPVALAINRATGWNDAWVTKTSLIREGNSRFHWPLPDAVREFIDAYDDGREVGPFTFSLPVDGPQPARSAVKTAFEQIRRLPA